MANLLYDIVVQTIGLSKELVSCMMYILAEGFMLQCSHTRMGLLNFKRIQCEGAMFFDKFSGVVDIRQLKFQVVGAVVGDSEEQLWVGCVPIAPVLQEDPPPTFPVLFRAETFSVGP